MLFQEKICSICSSTFSSGAKYCSRICGGKSNSKNMKSTCQQCNKEFPIWPSRIKKGGGQYCSAICRVEGSKNKEIRFCIYCNDRFMAYLPRINEGYAKYCKNECRLKHKHEISIKNKLEESLAIKRVIRPSILKNCFQCKKQFKTFYSEKRKYCSKECANFTITSVEKFFKSISNSDHENGCWEWKAKKDKNGYGIIYATKNTRAHRFSYELYHGKIFENLIICHKCDNPPCVNPDHLFMGTHKDNAQDRQQKNRGHFKSRMVK